MSENLTPTLVQDAMRDLITELKATSVDMTRDFSAVACEAVRKAGQIVAASTRFEVTAELVRVGLESRQSLVEALNRMGNAPMLAPVVREQLRKFDAQLLDAISDDSDRIVMASVLEAAPRPALLAAESQGKTVWVEERGEDGKIVRKQRVELIPETAKTE